MTDTCAECKYRQLCEELGYELDCDCRNECAHYDSFLEGEEIDEWRLTVIPDSKDTYAGHFRT